MDIQVNMTKPVEPVVESVTLALNLDEALYIMAEIGAGNSSVHPGQPDVYQGLADALDIGLDGSNKALRERLEKQLDVARTLRGGYDYSAAKEAAQRHGLIG